MPTVSSPLVLGEWLAAENKLLSGRRVARGITTYFAIVAESSTIQTFF